MEEIKKTLKDLNLEELEKLKEFITELIREKEREQSEEFLFDVDIETDPRKGKPYVARLTLKEGKLEREFFNLSKSHGKKSMRIFGSFKAKEGDVIEIREGASWKNDHRYIYMVSNGELNRLGRTDNTQTIKTVYEYLSGKLTKEEILKEIQQ